MQPSEIELFTSNLRPHLSEFVTQHCAPSNIALVKYWGKYENQIPANPSISFTLSKANTLSRVRFVQSEKLGVRVRLGGKEEPSFAPKIEKFIQAILPFCPYLSGYRWEVDTENSFPHSSGIASSASGFAALALCVCSLEQALGQTPHPNKASFLARLGSGSACRSIEGPIVSWGNHQALPASSDLFGSVFAHAHPVFTDYRDTILLVHKGVKEVSSTLGHSLMENHWYAEARFKQANQHFSELVEVLKSGDLERFVEIVESEALSLHAMMLSSRPSFILMQPNTLAILQKVRAFREAANIQVCFTLDAGANVHLLYPNLHRERVQEWVQRELVMHCEDHQILHDFCGKGAE